MDDDKIPVLIFQFCSFYYNSKKEFNSNIIRHLRDLIEVINEDRDNLVLATTKPIVIGDIIPSIFLSERSHFFIYHIFDFDDVDQIIQQLNNDISTISDPEEDIIVKFVCDFQIKN